MPHKTYAKQRVVDGQRERECSKCGAWKLEDAAHFPMSPKGYLRSYCRECNRAGARAWLAKQREKLQSLAADSPPAAADFNDAALRELQLTWKFQA